MVETTVAAAAVVAVAAVAVAVVVVVGREVLVVAAAVVVVVVVGRGECEEHIVARHTGPKKETTRVDETVWWRVWHCPRGERTRG